MKLVMYVDLSTDEELEKALEDYEKAKIRLIRCLERERLVVKEKTASNETDAVK